MITNLRFVVRGIAICAIVLFSFLFADLASAQTSRFNVTGVVVDSVGGSLQGATIVALTRADSILTKFATTNGKGEFTLRRVPEGEYILQITFVGFQPLRRNFTLADEAYDAGTLTLDYSVAELGELIVSAEHIPIVVRGDTLEYNAAAFATRPNAVVEDLLRKLPGIEVEADGTIKAQGETVRQIFVDGKEFFGNDPKIATRNLPADAIAKVQVYDKLSDMAEFTGVDDGEETKTINLELKEEARQGYFGNMSGGYGDDGRYDGQASINRFSSTTQLSFLGNVNNVNRQGFSFGDYMSFMGGMQAIMIDGGRMSGGGVQVGTNINDGFSETLALGLNASRDLNSKTFVSGSYFLSSIENQQTRTIQQQQLLGSSLSSLVQENNNQLSDNLSHRLNVSAKYDFAKGHDIRFRGNFSTSTSSLTSSGLRSTLGTSGIVQNTSETTYITDGDQTAGDASLTYRKRLNEKGRSFVAVARLNLNDSETGANLNSLTGILGSRDIFTYDEIAQIQASLGNTLQQTQRISLSEPLGKGRLIELRAERRQINEDKDKTVSDLVNGSLILNNMLSSGLDRTYTYYKAGLNFRKNWESVNFGIGIDIQESTLDGTILDKDVSISNGFTHWLPSANLRWSINQGQSLSVRYSASTREPSMTELQPFTDNDDPLNVYVGNPELEPEYRHRTSINYHFFDQFTFTNMFAYLSANYTQNKIVRSRTIDDSFKQQITSVNTDGDWTFSGSLYFGTPIRPIGAKINLSNSAVYSRGIEFINAEENRSNILRNTLGIKLENRNKDLFDVGVGAQFTFNNVSYSLNENLNQNYVNSTYSANASYYLGESWEFSTALDYRAYSQQVFGSSSSVPLLQASITKTLMNQRADVQLVGLDLLDRNEGINFSNTGNVIQEVRTNSIGRYVMLKFIYRISGRSGGRGNTMFIEGH